MKIQFECKYCGKKYSVSEEHSGKKGKCKQCGNQIQIPYKKKKLNRNTDTNKTSFLHGNIYKIVSIFFLGAFLVTLILLIRNKSYYEGKLNYQHHKIDSLKTNLEMMISLKDSLMNIKNRNNRISNPPNNILPKLVLLNMNYELTMDKKYRYIEATIKNLSVGDASDIEIYFSSQKSFQELLKLQKDFEAMIEKHNNKYQKDVIDDREMKRIVYSKNSYLFYYSYINYLPSNETIKIKTSKIPVTNYVEELSMTELPSDGIPDRIQLIHMMKVIGLSSNNFVYKKSN